MKLSESFKQARARPSKYWMRAVSFAGLHRILKAVAAFPQGLRSGEIDRLVLEKGILLTRHNSVPSHTTLYHYRNTLIRLLALKQVGPTWRVNCDEPDVCKLLSQPAPALGDCCLDDCAKDSFSALVLKNKQCRVLFFDLFMPVDKDSKSLSAFHQNGLPVAWSRNSSPESKEIVFKNHATGRTRRYGSYVGEQATLFGLRYWARDELQLIDEYCPQAASGAVMFPICRTRSAAMGVDPPEFRTIAFLLSLRNSDEWTLFSVLDLIVLCCENRQKPIKELFKAIDWLVQEWPHHIVLIPTSRALATLTAISEQRQALELRRYYKRSNGPYISHIRIHKDIVLDPVPLTSHHHVQSPAKTTAQIQSL